MAKLNIESLQAVLQSLSDHLQQLAAKDAVHQDAVNALVDPASKLDAGIVAIIAAPDPGPRTDIDFAQLDAAVNVFKQNTKISQTDVDNVAGLIVRNTPQ